MSQILIWYCILFEADTFYDLFPLISNWNKLLEIKVFMDRPNKGVNIIHKMRLSSIFGKSFGNYNQNENDNALDTAFICS